MIISLCSGYGGLDRAVAAAFRLPVGAHAEPLKVHLRKGGPLVENPVIRVLERRFPGVPNLGDIRETDWAPWRGLCRVLCAGFPCQPVSAAGRQLAEDDERWLWPSVHRAVLGLAPEWIVLENVANIVSIQGGAIWRMILAHLREAGYDVAWGIFGACLVGACHHRHRMFLVASLRKDHSGRSAVRWPGKPCGAKGDALPSPAARDGSSRGEGSAEFWAAKRLERPVQGIPLGAEPAMLPGSAASPYGSNRGGAAGRVGPVRHSLDQLARLDLLPTPQARDGRANSPTLSARVATDRYAAGKRNLEDGLASLLPTPQATDGTNGGPNQRGSKGDLALPSAALLLPSPRAGDSTRGIHGPDRVPASGHTRTSDLGAALAWEWGRFTVAVTRHAAWMGSPPAPTEIGPRGGVRMAAPFPEWMMGLTAGYVTDVLARNDALRAIGNGVMPQQGFYAIRTLLAMLA